MNTAWLYGDKLWDKGILLVRIIVALLIIKIGFEITNQEKMTGYIQWLTDVHMPLPAIMPYVGKIAEILGGILLLLGLFTRIASAILIINMFVITFIMLEGKVWGDDQYPFLFLLLFAIFLCLGAGKWSLDRLILNRITCS